VEASNVVEPCLNVARHRSVETYVEAFEFNRFRKEESRKLNGKLRSWSFQVDIVRIDWFKWETREIRVIIPDNKNCNIVACKMCI